MFYQMECKSCGASFDICCSVADHEEVVKPGWSCLCGGRAEQVITAPATVFAKEGFPAKDPRWEHASPDGTVVRSKGHLKDLCAEHGNVSRFLEDDV